MSVITKLADLEKIVEDSGKNYEDRPKAEWVKLKDGQAIQVDFLQELDPDSDNYNDDAGQILVVVEHTNPNNYRKRAECTAEEEGKCYGCEQYKLNPKDNGQWKGKARLYANVLHDGTVKILSQGTSAKSITPGLVMAANDNKSVTNISFKIKRQGSDFNNTSYNLMPVIGSKGVDASKFLDQMYDLRTVCTRQIPYDEQETFYNDGPVEATADAGNASKVEW